MTTTLQLQKEVEKLKEKVKPKARDRVVVNMWMPGGKDSDDPNNLFIIKATNKGETE